MVTRVASDATEALRVATRVATKVMDTTEVQMAMAQMAETLAAH